MAPQISNAAPINATVIPIAKLLSTIAHKSQSVHGPLQVSAQIGTINTMKTPQPTRHHLVIGFPPASAPPKKAPSDNDCKLQTEMNIDQAHTDVSFLHIRAKVAPGREAMPMPIMVPFPQPASLNPHHSNPSPKSKPAPAPINIPFMLFAFRRRANSVGRIDKRIVPVRYVVVVNAVENVVSLPRRYSAGLILTGSRFDEFFNLALYVVPFLGGNVAYDISS